MNTQDFIATIAPQAVLDQMTSGVLASITVAQGILESDSGQSAPGNNLFGIKGDGQELQTKEFINGVWVTIVTSFRVYDSWGASILDHSAFLRKNIRYTQAGFFDSCNKLDYEGAAKALQAAGYATDPNYAEELIQLIQIYGLDKYDREAVSVMQEIEDLKSRVASLEKLTKALIKTPMPDWYLTEFGAHALDGIANDPTGDNDFWRTTAISFRLLKAKNL